MTAQTKVCQSCQEVNPIDARECRSCGRYFIAAPRRSQPYPLDEALKQPTVICAAILLLALFLPWFSLLFFNISAIQIIGLSKETGGLSMQAGGLFTWIKVCLYLIPIGCVAVFVLSLRGAWPRPIGILTGSLPLAIFIPLFLKSTDMVSFMGAGFIIAILAGIGLIVFSLRES